MFHVEHADQIFDREILNIICSIWSIAMAEYINEVN